MKLAVTTAFTPTSTEKELLSSRHELCFVDDGKPLKDQSLDFDLATVEGIICNFFFTHNDLSVFPNLRVIQTTSAGLDRIPLEEAKEKGIAVFNAGDTYAIPMAEWAVAKTLEIVKCSEFFRKNQAEHIWEKKRDIKELYGMTAAIIGFGNVGRAVAERFKAFGVKIRAVDLANAKSPLADKFFEVSDLKNAVGNADIIVLCLPLTPETQKIIDADVLKTVKDDAILINVARGGLIDELALIKELRKGRFSGVALDVFENEPLDEKSPLWDFPNVLVSPHNSFIGNGNHDRLFRIICKNLDNL